MQRSFLVFFGLLVFWCLLVFLERKSLATGLLKPVFFGSLVVAWSGFYWASAKTEASILRSNTKIRRLLVSSGLWVVSVFVALVLAVNFKFMLGGTL